MRYLYRGTSLAGLILLAIGNNSYAATCDVEISKPYALTNNGYIPERALVDVKTGSNCRWTATLNKDQRRRIVTRISDDKGNSSRNNSDSTQMFYGQGPARIFLTSLSTSQYLIHTLSVKSSTTNNVAQHRVYHCSNRTSCDGSNIRLLENVDDINPLIEVGSKASLTSSLPVYFSTGSSFNTGLRVSSSASWLSVGGKPLRLDSRHYEGNPHYRWRFSINVTQDNTSTQPRHAYITILDNAATFGKRVIRVTQAGNVNQAPVVSSTSATVQVGRSVTLDLTESTSDPDGDRLSYSISARPSSGTASLSLSGILTSTPNQSTNASSDRLSYTVNDGQITRSADVRFTLTPESTGSGNSDSNGGDNTQSDGSSSNGGSSGSNTGGSSGGSSNTGGDFGGGSSGGSASNSNSPGSPFTGDYIRAPFGVNDEGRTDLVVFRPSNGTWYVLPRGPSYAPFRHSYARAFQFGLPGDIPIVGDLDSRSQGGYFEDLIVWRPSISRLLVNDSGNGFASGQVDRQIPTGNSSTDTILLGDLDGNGYNEVVTVTAGGHWNYQDPSTNQPQTFGYGRVGDKYMLVDWDGDGRDEATVYRESSQKWFIRNKPSKVFGSNNSVVPVPADYTGDGLPELAFWDKVTGNWHIYNRQTGQSEIIQFGLPGDVPVVGHFDLDNVLDIAVYRSAPPHQPLSPLWYIKYRGTGQTDVIQWGLPGDVVPQR